MEKESKSNSKSEDMNNVIASHLDNLMSDFEKITGTTQENNAEKKSKIDIQEPIKYSKWYDWDNILDFLLGALVWAIFIGGPVLIVKIFGIGWGGIILGLIGIAWVIIAFKESGGGDDNFPEPGDFDL